MNRGAFGATVHRVTQSWTRLKGLGMHARLWGTQDRGAGETTRTRVQWLLDLKIAEAEKLSFGGLGAISVVEFFFGRDHLRNPTSWK